MEQLIDFFQDKKVKTLLDVGTGTGDFITVLKDVFANVQITGVDPNTESLEKAKETYPEVDFLEMGAEILNFPDNSFETASISMALHHLPDIQKSLAEMTRVVKKDGWIIISELYSDNLNPAQEVHKMYHHFRSQTDRILGISHNKTFKREKILQMVKDTGIDVQRHFDYTKDLNMVLKKEDLDERVIKMKQMLERIKEYPEYETLKLQIEKFRNNALKFGFQPATCIVIVGKVK